MQLVIGSVVRAHGVRGEVVVAVTTDEPQDRYVVGSVLETDPATAGPLTIEGLRVHTSSGVDRLLVAFEGVEDRDAAERLRGVKLLVDAADIEPSDDPDEFHDFQLIGLAVHVGEAPPVGDVEPSVRLRPPRKASGSARSSGSTTGRAPTCSSWPGRTGVRRWCHS